MRRHLSRPSPATVISLVALFIALGGTGRALTLGTRAANTIHACVNNKSGVLRILAAHQRCRTGGRDGAGEHEISWSERGPVGATGATGAIGPSDAYAANGTPTSLTVPPGDYVATGDCAAGLAENPSAPGPQFGEAYIALYTQPGIAPARYPADGSVSFSSVPSRGDVGPINQYGGNEYGSASLATSAAFVLPHGGTIREDCEVVPVPFGGPGGGTGSESGDIGFGNGHLLAIRVADLHQG